MAGKLAKTSFETGPNDELVTVDAYSATDDTSLSSSIENNVVKPVTEAFDKLKRALTSAPILSYPNNEGLFILDTDASNNGLGAVLSQEQNGIEKSFPRTKWN